MNQPSLLDALARTTERVDAIRGRLPKGAHRGPGANLRP